MSKSRWAVVVVAACVALAVCGCKEGEKANNFTHILSTFRGEPLISSQGDPSNPVSAMRTFSLVSTGSPDDPLAEKQMLWLLRSHLEGYGYQCVEEPTSADFVVTVATSNEYRQLYIPPSSVTVPWYVPSETVRASGQWYGSGSATGWSSAGGSASAWGSASGTSSSTVTLPGYWTTRTFEHPGSAVGSYYPVVAVGIYDRRRLDAGVSPRDALIWRSSCVGISTSPQFSLTGQYILWLALGNNLPLCAAEASGRFSSPGKAGVALMAMTPDGQAMYPVVRGVAKDSPAQRAGIQTWDIIAAINGNGTKNRDMKETAALLGGNPGDIRTLTIWRLTEEKVVKVTLASAASINGK